MLLVKCDFLYSCAAADKIPTDFRARAVSLRQLSYLFGKLNRTKSQTSILQTPISDVPLGAICILILSRQHIGE